MDKIQKAFRFRKAHGVTSGRRRAALQKGIEESFGCVEPLSSSERFVGMCMPFPKIDTSTFTESCVYYVPFHVVF